MGRRRPPPADDYALVQGGVRSVSAGEAQGTGDGPDSPLDRNGAEEESFHRSAEGSEEEGRAAGEGVCRQVAQI
ncbi:hypothetical protein D3C71_1708400 [compost metagenome]